MPDVEQKKLFWQDRTATFWTLSAFGVISACFAVLVCSTLGGIGVAYFIGFQNEGATQSQTGTVFGLPESALNKAAEPNQPKPNDAATDSADTSVEVVMGLVDDDPQPPKLGNPAAKFNLETLDGEIVSLADFAGQPIILNFWATWCGPCEAEMPDIHEAYLTHKEEGLVVLAIDIAEHPDTVKSFVDYYNLSFHILLDDNQDVAHHYGARALPTTYFIDRSGNIAHVYFGQMGTKDIEVGLRKILP